MYILSESQVFLFNDLSWRVFKKSFIMSRVLSLLPTFSKRSTSLIADFILHLNSSQDGYSVSNVPRAASHVAKTTHFSSISLWSGWTLWPLCQKWHHCHLNTFLRGWCQSGGDGLFRNSRQFAIDYHAVDVDQAGTLHQIATGFDMLWSHLSL